MLEKGHAKQEETSNLKTVTLTWWTVQDQTGGKENGLFVRNVWGAFPAARAAGPQARQAGPRGRCIRHLHPAAARHHFPPFYDPDLRDRVCPWRRADGFGMKVDGTSSGTGRRPDAGAAELPDHLAHAAASLVRPGQAGDEGGPQ